MDLTAEYNNAINILGGYDIREVREKLNTPQAEQVMQALRNYVNAWIELMRAADGFEGLPEP